MFGLSRQRTDYQRELAVRLVLPFPILSDEGERFAGGAAPAKVHHGGEVYLKRLTLLIRAGLIEAVFYPVADPSGHAAEVLSRLSEGPR